MPGARNDDVLDLARAVLTRLPVEMVTPREREQFDENAKLWIDRVAGDSRAQDGGNGSGDAPGEGSGRGHGYGLGLQDVVPEATSLALFAAQTAVGTVVQAGVIRLARAALRRRRSRREHRREQAPALSTVQGERVRARITARLVHLGVPDETAALFAQSVVAELQAKDAEDAEPRR